jgi:hypothetical protein
MRVLSICGSDGVARPGILTDNIFSPWYQIGRLELQRHPDAIDVMCDLYDRGPHLFYDLVAHIGDIVALPCILDHAVLDAIFERDLF